MSTAAVVLAAGGSTRLGRSKQLEPWGESNLLGHVLARTFEFPVDEVWVILGHDAERILAESDLGDAYVVENLEWEEGIASSLRVGLDALTRLSRCEIALIVIGDQPDIPVEVVEELLASHQRSGKPVSIPKYRYTRGNPVLVDRSLWARVMSLEGDDGAQRLWQAHPEWVNEVWFPGSAPRDVDTEADVAELRPRHSA
ncbi:MAG TPA: nucleotidyltransferase family protein [Acidimicrobiia bacterium]|jgi:molybdenum cofactor cytidylyltransferase|nr:nucleotidyltransferase family protein [Acidimicrobiia bacterium]